MSWPLALTAPRAVFLLFSVSLTALGLACGPSAAPTASPTAPASDPFAVVRATSQAAYRQGKTLVDSGDIMRGCPLIDTAKTNDPDNRPDVQAALESCITAIASFTPEPTRTPGAVRTIVLPTLEALNQTPPMVTPPAGFGIPTPPVAAASANDRPPGAAAGASPIAVAATSTVDMTTFADPQGRFTIAAPTSWTRLDNPHALFGSGVVQFRAPSGVAALDVAVDGSTRAVSPELYAATLELAMQAQVPDYASEQTLPTSVSGAPAIRRVFTFTQRDANGRDLQARAFQTVVVKGQTPYIITATAPASQAQQVSPEFDQMVQSFQFS